ncbi:hypothetical protein GE09DRAFT_1231204 [Coniochaeta sp. 2T2.1]|nr:hypothetical protein GE09DRAFT_1231204 [Coniochaeta sp. 2T2.1]
MPHDHGPVCRMQVKPTQVYDGDVHQLQRELLRRLQHGDGFTSDSLTEPFSDGEVAASIRELGQIWTGRYLVGFQPLPLVPDLGWTAGKGRLPGASGADLLLCTVAFAKKHGINLRTLHARFNFDLQNRAFFIAGKSSSQHAELTVNGTIVGRQMFTLNQYSMKIEFDKLKYVFQYTDWAATPAFRRERDNYMTDTRNGPQAIDFEMPTPSRSVRTIGEWTLSAPLGRGGMGRVFLASNSKNQVAAVKIVEWNSSTKDSVDCEVQTLRKLTALAKEWDADERIVVLAVLQARLSPTVPARHLHPLVQGIRNGVVFTPEDSGLEDVLQQ